MANTTEKVTITLTRRDLHRLEDALSSKINNLEFYLKMTTGIPVPASAIRLHTKVAELKLLQSKLEGA